MRNGIVYGFGDATARSVPTHFAAPIRDIFDDDDSASDDDSPHTPSDTVNAYATSDGMLADAAAAAAAGGGGGGARLSVFVRVATPRVVLLGDDEAPSAPCVVACGTTLSLQYKRTLPPPLSAESHASSSSSATLRPPGAGGAATAADGGGDAAMVAAAAAAMGGSGDAPSQPLAAAPAGAGPATLIGGLTGLRLHRSTRALCGEVFAAASGLVSVYKHCLRPHVVIAHSLCRLL